MTDTQAQTSRLRSGMAAGGSAAATGLAFALLVRLVTGAPSLAEAVAERITLILPLPIFDALLAVLGPIAKPLLVVVIAVAVIVLGAAGGWLAARQTARAPVAAAGLAVALGVASLALAVVMGATETGTLAGAALGALAFGGIFWRTYDPDARPPSAETDQNRRHLLQWGALGLVVLAVGGGLIRLFTGAGGRSATGRLPTPITSNEDFYVISKNLIDPSVDGATWRLRVGGLVDRELSLSLDEIREMEAVDQVQTLECISNEVGGDLISTARWRGVRLRDVIAMAGPAGSAIELKLEADDGYTESIPAELAADDRVLLAYEMNGEPLPQRHGFPLRLLLPGRYGMKGPKWLTRIELIDQPYEGYWEQRGWTKEAIVKTMSRIDAPGSGPARNAAGVVQLAGIAFSGDRGISGVELRIGPGEEWVEADLDPAFADLAWQFWRYDWRPDPGTYEVEVRATDGAGELQTARVAPTLPDGASGYDGVRYTIA